MAKKTGDPQPMSPDEPQQAVETMGGVLDLQPMSLDEFAQTEIWATKRGIETMGGFMHWMRRQGMATVRPAAQWREQLLAFRQRPA
jgi:hypothetical protein